MKEINLDFERSNYLMYCTDPIYLSILNAYFDYLGANIPTARTGSFYDALYEDSSLDTIQRTKLMKNNGTLECIKKVAEDFGVTDIEYTYKSSFTLGESHLNLNDVLKKTAFKENFFKVKSYTDYYRLCEFVSFYNKNMKPAGIKCSIQTLA